MVVSLDSPVTHEMCAKYLQKLNTNGPLQESEYLSCYEICYTVFDKFSEGFDDFHDNIISLYSLMQENYAEAQHIRMLFHHGETVEPIPSTMFLAVLTANFLQYASSPPEDYHIVPANEVFAIYRPLMPLNENEEKLNPEDFTRDLDEFLNLSNLYPDFPDSKSVDEKSFNQYPVSSNQSPTNDGDDSMKSKVLPSAPKVGLPLPPRMGDSQELPHNSLSLIRDVFDEEKNDTDTSLDDKEIVTSVPRVGSVDTYHSTSLGNSDTETNELDNGNPSTNANSDAFVDNDNDDNSNKNNSSSSDESVEKPSQEIETPGNVSDRDAGDSDDGEKISSGDVDRIIGSDVIKDIKNSYSESGVIPDIEDGIKDLFDIDDSMQAVFDPLLDDRKSENKPSNIESLEDNNTENEDSTESSGSRSLLSEGLERLRDGWKAVSVLVSIAILLIGFAIFSGSNGTETDPVLRTETITTTPSAGKPKVVDEAINPVSIANSDELGSLCSDPYNSLSADPNKPFICNRIYNFDYINVVYKFSLQRVSKITIVTGDQTTITFSRGINSWCNHFAATDFIFQLTSTVRIPYTIDVSLNKNPKLPKTIDLVDILNKGNKTNPDYPNGIETDSIEMLVVGAKLAGGCSLHNKRPASQGEPSGNFALEKITFFHRVSIKQ